MKVGDGALQSLIMQDKVPVKKEESAQSKKSEGNFLDPGIGKPTLNQEDLVKAVEEMNKTMDMLNRDFKFKMHEETDRVMVKILDQKSHEVIKEFPPEEMLDLLAKIKESVGLLVDKYV